eukprot:TRINITY_DN90887_c0_g1_i1.p1 TRINITY_DN90887_c0_g1~~TRINITY_DN90887_c0_g1_i1.p1  ORF type:complete len:838 (+),score=245.76 TRINITY_DN90887_c0_g1_i1:69-2516(+)
MSLDWNDRDLLEWAQRTLPEFLLVCMKDPENRKRILAKTPWQGYELSIAEVQLEGEFNLIGRKSQPMLQFDLDLGMRVDVEMKVEGREKRDEDYWPGVAQIIHFDNQNLQPPIITRLQELPDDVAPEVNWYLQDGMGKHFIWHGLARWHAYAVKKWLKQDSSTMEDPYCNPLPAPAFPPFLEEARKQHEEEIRRVLLSEDDDDDDSALAEDLQLSHSFPSSSSRAAAILGRKMLSEQEGNPGYVSPPTSDDEGDFDHLEAFEFSEGSFEQIRRGGPVKRKKFRRYPFLPSMLCGLGGPAKDWLRPKEYAIGHPEWTDASASSCLAGALKTTAGGVTHLDMILEKARKRREEFERLSAGKLVSMRAADLCDAIEKGDVMKTFAKLDEESASCPHPDTGRCAAHCCIAKGSQEFLLMVLEARADVNAKDSFGQTALMMAAKQGDHASVKALLEAGADAAATDSLGRTAAEMVKLIKPEAEDEVNPLKNWREKMAGELPPEDPAKKSMELKSMIDSKERPRKYGTSLLSALSQRDGRTAEAAIEAGGDVNILDDKGDSAFLLLVKTKWKEQQGLQARLVQKAFKAGANLDFQNAAGNSPLHFAAHRGNIELVELLVKLQADPSLINSEGNTALMYAANGGHEEVCTMLLEACAPLDVANQKGLTAEGLAQSRGFKTCAALIHAYALAPKRPDEAQPQPKKKEKKKYLAFDYSKWDALEQEMRADEEAEQNTKQREASAAVRRPMPKFEDVGPEAFGLPADTPWPPDSSLRKKGPFDYGHWDKIVDDIERQDKVIERYEDLQKNPRYEYRDGQKLQVIF